MEEGCVEHDNWPVLGGRNEVRGAEWGRTDAVRAFYVQCMKRALRTTLYEGGDTESAM